MTPNPNMKKLSITYSSSEITSDHVIAICKTFPSLKELQLSPCTDIQSAFIVPEYFLSMQKLDVFLSNHGVEMAFLDQDEPCREQGITDLVIGGHLQDDNTGNDIVSLLQYYQGTLVHLKWNAWLDNNEDDLYHIPFSCLKKLSFGYSAFQIPWNAPVLEELDFKAQSIANYPTVLDTIPCHMKKLDITLYHTLSFNDATIIGEYLNRIAQQQNVQLSELVLNINHLEHIENALEAIGSLHYLERLMITCWNLVADQLERFLEILAIGCPDLKCFKINCTNAPSIDAIHTLKRLDHLKELAFSVEGVADNTSFWDSIQTLSQLECIEIYPRHDFNKFDIRYLNEQRPDIKVRVYNHSLRF
ncbi:hypothetical protein K492DRAFT_200342 [Lichtheimia hyalospora FSU 10163]|nr:hypothetical protein K492DRAFT_200342 [Lichtheimia hyalospora FSU 10163]